MEAVLEVESKLTERYQTTVPDPVRRALGLSRHDRIVYRLLDTGEVVLSRKSDAQEGDPVIGAFLAFMANDMEAHPERIRALDPSLRGRMAELVGDIDIDLDQPLDPNDE